MDIFGPKNFLQIMRLIELGERFLGFFLIWKSGKFYFRQQKLKDNTKVLSRWYDVEIFFVNCDSENKRLTGRFKCYENFDHVRSIIELTEEVSFVKKGKTVIIKQRK